MNSYWFLFENTIECFPNCKQNSLEVSSNSEAYALQNSDAFGLSIRNQSSIAAHKYLFECAASRNRVVTISNYCLVSVRFLFFRESIVFLSHNAFGKILEYCAG